VIDIEVSTSSSSDAASNAISRSCGSAVSACASALPACPVGSKPNFAIKASSCARSTGTFAGGADSAALVHRPAWIDSRSTLLPFTSGMMTRSSSTRRCTADKPVRLDQQRCRSALVEPGEGRFERGGRQELAVAAFADAQRILHLAVARAPFMAELGHRPALEPAQQFGGFALARIAASASIAARIARQSRTAARTSRSAASSPSSRRRRARASPRSSSI
jgi:hypothetical protein